MKGDFTRFTDDPRKHYTRVLKQQGRVDLDADWNEAIEIFTRRDRTEATDVIGRCGVPLHDGGFKIEPTPDGIDLTISPGRMYVDGILCEQLEAENITQQDDLPDYQLPEDDGVYLAYVTVWDRHITYLEDPELREVALGGPDTTTRTRTIHQVRLLRLADDEPLDLHECEPYPADPGTGRLAARSSAAVSPTNPCAVPEGAGYTGLENRLYRVEIHDDGRDADGNVVRPATFKWSRDNGSVVLPIADENGIDGDTVTLKRLGFDEVLTVKVGNWVEVLGDTTELYGRPGTLAQIVPDGIDKDDLEVELNRDVSTHQNEAHLKLRRWDHQATDDLALIDGALPIPAGPFELEDGVIIEFEPGGTYHVGDYWVMPARTREGDVLWPEEGTPPVAVLLPPFGIHRHYCTLALARRSGGEWMDVLDCRPIFPPLTEVGDGCCCISVEPGDDIQQAIDTVVAAGGGCVTLCEGVHVVNGVLRIRDASDVTLRGENTASIIRFEGISDQGPGGLIIQHAHRIAVEDLFVASDSVPALIAIRHGAGLARSRQIALRRLILLNLTPSNRETNFTCGVRLGHSDGVSIDECRIAAEVGILSLWGDDLPDLAGEPSDDNPPSENPPSGDNPPSDAPPLPGQPPEQPTLDYGEGVADLRMRDSTIRFRVLGILASRAERWQIDRADIRPYDEESWTAVRDSFRLDDGADVPVPATGGRVVHSQALALLESVFAGSGELRGMALLAFRWHGSAVRDSILAGRHGMQVWWWLHGTLHGNHIVAEESGSHAFWLYESDWSENDVETTDGIALSVAGCCRVRIEHNRLRGPVGLANFPFNDALDGLDLISQAILRGYGTNENLDIAIALGILVDESLEIMGFAPLMNALQPIIDEASPTPGIPPAYFIAPRMIATLRAQGDSGFFQALPLIDLHVVHNDVGCRQQGIVLDGYLPLGSLRVADNRIHTTTGQAVRIETNPYVANAHLTVFLVRALLRQFYRLVAGVRETTEDGPLADVLEALETLFERWVEGAESLFDLDFRVEGNTIRSLRTAIESNLFELSVLTNHITMQERTALRVADERPGIIFGSVMTPQGGAVTQATVRVVGTERVVLTDAKAQYRITGLPAGEYTLRATRAGFTVDTKVVTLRAGEQVEANFTIFGLIASVPPLLNDGGFSDAVMGRRAILASVSNSEIREVIEALESSPAMEPLGTALREGSHTQPEMYANYLAAEGGPLGKAEDRDAAADAVTLIRGQTSDPELRQVAGELNTALRANDRTLLQPLLIRFILALYRYVDSQGILIKSIGGRIIGNQVIVPADVRADTEALGGIQVSVNLSYLTILALLGTIVLRYLGGQDDDEPAPADPLLGITETLIDSNEVIGGIGHGVSVQGVAGQPDFLNDLRIRSNQIRGMAGTGIYINEHALVVGLDVTDNTVSACARLVGFTRQKGGIVVRTAGVCSFRGNHVVRCGDELHEIGVYGVDLDGLYGLRFIGNEIQANGSESSTADDGGLRLIEVYGSTLLHDNTFAFNRGLGLSWANSAREDEAALLPPFLMQAVSAYLRTSLSVDEIVEEEQASVQSNVLKSLANSDIPVFQLLNLRDVLFSGNTCRADTVDSPLGEIQQATRGVVTNNQTQTAGDVAIAIKKMAGGVVLGNVGNRPIQLQASAGVERAYNVPPVT